MNAMARTPKETQHMAVPSWIKNFLPLKFMSLIVVIEAKKYPPLTARVAAPTSSTLSSPFPIIYSIVFLRYTPIEFIPDICISRYR
jgi:hypothetical protein